LAEHRCLSNTVRPTIDVEDFEPQLGLLPREVAGDLKRGDLVELRRVDAGGPQEQAASLVHPLDDDREGPDVRRVATAVRFYSESAADRL
jgi:hypothetical protein